MGLKGFQEQLMEQLYGKDDDKTVLTAGSNDDIDAWIYDDVKGGYKAPKPVCDCGVKFTGGRHSDWCKGRAGQIQSEPDPKEQK